MIPHCPPGSNITILDSHYIYPQKDENGKYSEDRIQLLYRDNDTGKKHIYELINPTYTFYMSDEEIYIPEEQNLFFIDKDDVQEVTVPYKDLLKNIAELTDNTEFFYDNLKRRDRRANNELHMINTIFNSDMNIDDHYRYLFDKMYKNETFTISKGYFDIEVDTLNMAGDFPEMGECPINAISYINARDNKVSLFLLRDLNNPQIEEYEKGLMNGSILRELKDFIIKHVGGEKYAKKHGIFNFEYNVYMYDDELEMLTDLFKLINYDELDFMLAWNMPFDFPYIYHRIEALGGIPNEIMCHPEAETKICKYYIDIRNQNVPEQRGDFFYVSGKTIYLDQLVQFASRRKGQSNFENNKLDYIGQVIAKVRKLDWSDIAKTFDEFIRKNYKMFTFYNVMDTLVQHCIENKINDIDYVFNKALINNTRYAKVHRQTVYLANRAIKEFNDMGFIVGNNSNRNNEKPKEKFPGALVSNPINNSDYAKIIINGKAINVANNLDDYDFKSLYPSILREFGIAPNTQIGKVIIDRVVHDLENMFKYGKYDRGSQMFEDLHTFNYIEFGKRWLHLASYREMLDDMAEFFKYHQPNGYFGSHDNRFIKMNTIGRDNTFIKFGGRHIDPFVIVNTKRTNFDLELDFINNNAQMDLDNIERLLERKRREEEEDEELAREFGYDDIMLVNKGGEYNYDEEGINVY